MGVPTSEVGYTPAMPRREDHEVHKGHVEELGGGGNKFALYEFNSVQRSLTQGLDVVSQYRTALRSIRCGLSVLDGVHRRCSVFSYVWCVLSFLGIYIKLFNKEIVKT